MIQTIAIDGPAAAGKTSVGRELARRLGWWFLDTGIMYRAVTWLALERSISPDDADGLGDLAAALQVQPVSKDGDSVRLEGQLVGTELRSPQVDGSVSNVSRHPAVRRALVEMQRRYAEQVVSGRNGTHAQGGGQGIVMVGRDIGTVVLPDAGLKVYLTASAEQRALRRWREIRARGQEADVGEVQREIESRDAIDSSRDDSPLRPAEDAWPLDTSGLTVSESVEAILGQAERR